MLEKINSPEDLKKLNIESLPELAQEIRTLIINTVSKTGGHLAPNLGVVELTVAMHYVFNSPKDKFIFDVGHQCYVHKILTGRKDKFHTLRQHKGISGFTSIKESCYDCYGAGHASTSISAAVGIAKARDIKKEKYKVISLIGDGSLTGGLAYEGINHLGHLGIDMTVILNDNKMSISKNVGAMARYLETLSVTAHEKRNLKTIFHELGFTYLGPVDGHNIKSLIQVLEKSKSIKGPVLIHVKTIKGKGYIYAENNKPKFHGLGPFNLDNGEVHKTSDIPTYTNVFSQTMIKLANKNKNIIAITAAMPSGTGLDEFGKTFPKRFFDVGIAEQHAVVFAAGLATKGLKPFCAIYSTFLQRAYDQVLHDVCLQNLPVVFCLDRAGIVGDDGPTHHGCFDLAYLRLIPNIVIMAPKDENELQHMLFTASEYNGPIAVRYPKGEGIGVNLDRDFKNLEIGKAELIQDGNDIAVLTIGTTAYLAKEAIKEVDGSIALVNSRFVKPLDEKLILELAKKTKNIITVEENCLNCGFGSAVLELLHKHNIQANVKRIGIPDKFISHGSTELLKKEIGLSKENIVKTLKEMINKK